MKYPIFDDTIYLQNEREVLEQIWRNGILQQPGRPACWDYTDDGAHRAENIYKWTGVRYEQRDRGQYYRSFN